MPSSMRDFSSSGVATTSTDSTTTSPRNQRDLHLVGPRVAQDPPGGAGRQATLLDARVPGQAVQRLPPLHAHRSCSSSSLPGQSTTVHRHLFLATPGRGLSRGRRRAARSARPCPRSRARRRPRRRRRTGRRRAGRGSTPSRGRRRGRSRGRGCAGRRSASSTPSASARSSSTCHSPLGGIVAAQLSTSRRGGSHSCTVTVSAATSSPSAVIRNSTVAGCRVAAPGADPPHEPLGLGDGGPDVVARAPGRCAR